MTDSLPCPFCGGTALLTYGTGAFTGCRTCGADGPQRVNGPDRDWNTRAAGPLTSHGYRPEHGDPLAWAAEQIEEAEATIRELRNDVATAAALNTTLLDALRASGESFSVRRWILERIFGKG